MYAPISIKKNSLGAVSLNSYLSTSFKGFPNKIAVLTNGQRMKTFDVVQYVI